VAISNALGWAWRFQRGHNIRVFITSPDVGLPELTEEEFIGKMRHTSAFRILYIVSALSVLQMNRRSLEGYDELTEALRLTGYACTEEVSAKLRSILREHPTRIFIHDQQLLLLAKAAILYGTDTDEPPGVESVEQLLLGANDVLGRDTEADDEADGDPITANRELRIVIRGLGGFNHQQMRYVLGRYFDLMVVRARHQHSLNLGPDLDAAFAKYAEDVVKMGPVTMEAYLGYVLMYFSMFSRATSLAELIHIVQSNRAGDYDGQTALMKPGELRRAFGLARDEFQEKFRGRDSLRLASFVPFRDRPLLLRGHESPIVISMPFLLDKVSTGIFHSLQQGFLRESGGQGAGTLGTHVGQIFQSYLSDLLTRMYRDMAGMKSRTAFYDEAAIMAASPSQRNVERPPFDGLIVEGNAVVTIEMSAISVTVTTAESANVTRLKDEVRRDFQKKFRQVKDGIDGLANGTWTAPDLDPSGIEDVYPVLALLVPFPQHSATWRVLRECGTEVWEEWPDRVDRTYETISRDGTRCFRIHAPQIITAEEWETLEALLVYSKQCLTTLLRMKMCVPIHGEMDMMDYLYGVLHVPDVLNTHVWRLTEKAMAAGIEALGLQEESAPKPVSG
jgi:hypothetical protein